LYTQLQTEKKLEELKEQTLLMKKDQDQNTGHTSTLELQTGSRQEGRHSYITHSGIILTRYPQLPLDCLGKASCPVRDMARGRSQAL
jgi:hypothetical protein